MMKKELLISVDCIHCSAEITGLFPTGIEIPEMRVPPDMNFLVMGHCSKHFKIEQVSVKFLSLCTITNKTTGEGSTCV